MTRPRHDVQNQSLAQPQGRIGDRKGGGLMLTRADPLGHTSKPRHRCRNPRCGCRLSEPTENSHAAFCARGCWEQYHRHRCVVCERPFERQTENQRVCGRRKCRAELKAWPAVYLPFQVSKNAGMVDCPSDSKHPSTNPITTREKTRTRSLRGWGWVEAVEAWNLHNRAGAIIARVSQEGSSWWVCRPTAIPDPPVEPLEAAQRRAETTALQALPLDPTIAARNRKANRIRSEPVAGADADIGT